MKLLDIVEYRAKVARMGEQDLFQWWDSMAGTDAGHYVLGRLFPRTGAWAALELAVSSARARHQALVPKIPTVHLFHLGAELERQLDDEIYRLKTSGSDVGPFQLRPPEVAWSSVVIALEALGVSPKHGNVAERAFCIGDVTFADLKSPDRLVRELVAAYGYSRPGHLVVPYLRLVEAS